MTSRTLTAIGLALASLFPGMDVQADGKRVHGQMLYVPVFSEIPYGDKTLTIKLAATLSIRNTDPRTPITIRRVDYFSSSGMPVRTYCKQPVTLKPMASTEYIVNMSDVSGGISASFAVEWENDTPAFPPLVEAVMVNSTYNHGLAFNSVARVLEERP